MELLIGLVVFGVFISVAMFLGGVVINVVIIAIMGIITLIGAGISKLVDLIKGDSSGKIN
jgi:hypothetical protein